MIIGRSKARLQADAVILTNIDLDLLAPSYEPDKRIGISTKTRQSATVIFHEAQMHSCAH